MCHTDIPPGPSTPAVARTEVEIIVGESERMPAGHVGTWSAPAVLIVGDVFGRSAFYEHLAALVGSAGFQALLPDFFFRQGPLPEGASKEAAFERRGRLDETRTLDDLRAAIGWMRERSGHGVVGTLGFCMGGTFVLDLASTETDLVTVAYYGFPVPQTTLVSPPPRPMDLVEGVRGPVLAFWGDQDATVGLDHVRRYAERATASNPSFEHEIVPGLGHGFLASSRLDDPDDPGGATWVRALSHFRTYLVND
jgi:dienelactone hydrolase